MTKIYKKILGLITLIGLIPLTTIASGVIDQNYKYAWGENIGWINFGCSGCNISITDSAITGYAWSENYGWINLNPLTSGVKNDGEGNLSGYAWGENLGWINFDGVSINSNGEFLGYAVIENDLSRISFNCQNTNSCSLSNFKVKTDWRARSVRPACNNGLDDDSDGKIDYPSDPGCSSLDDTDETDPIVSPTTGRGTFSQWQNRPIIKKISEILMPLIPEFLKPRSPKVTLPEIPLEKLIPKETPPALQGKWNLITYTLQNKPLARFTLAPLPKEIRVLAEKFPELKKVFKEVGISKLPDIKKLRTVKLTLPGLTKKVGLPTSKIEPGKLALPQSIPVANLPPSIKQQLPTDIVFARTGGELIDFNVVLTVNEKGKPEKRISAVSGKPLQLVIKPDKPVKSVKGYVVFRSKIPRQSSLEFPFNHLLTSLIFANPVFAKPQEKPIRVEEKLVLLEFEYTDPDGDGVYTAEIQAPVVEGEYEIITVMDFEDPELGKKEIRLITVIDPEGYIYEKDRGKETRIPGAIVSIYWLNPETKQYELWPAKEYQQENPQITDVRGTYSFLVPEGYYYLRVEAPGYLAYEGKPFQVKEGSGVHVNIELKTKHWWLKVVDWKTILLIFIIILLLYNFYRDKIREKFLKEKGF